MPDAHSRRDRGHRSQGLASPEGDVPAENGLRRMDGHHESHRASGRIGSRGGAHPRRADRRRPLQARGTKDLHHLRRARSHREHHPHGARAHPRGARGRQGHVPVRGSEVPRESRRLARRAERRALPLRRAQARHSREPHVRARLRTARRRRGRAHRRGKSRPRIHVHHDERGALRRGTGGHRALGAGISERPCVRERAHPGDGARGEGTRTDRAPPGYPPHAHADEIQDRGHACPRERFGVVARCGPRTSGRTRARPAPGIRRFDDPRRQGLVHGELRGPHLACDPGSRRYGIHRGDGRRAAVSGFAHHPDL